MLEMEANMMDEDSLLEAMSPSSQNNNENNENNLDELEEARVLDEEDDVRMGDVGVANAAHMPPPPPPPMPVAPAPPTSEQNMRPMRGIERVERVRAFDDEPPLSPLVSGRLFRTPTRRGGGGNGGSGGGNRSWAERRSSIHSTTGSLTNTNEERKKKKKKKNKKKNGGGKRPMDEPTGSTPKGKRTATAGAEEEEGEEQVGETGSSEGAVGGDCAGSGGGDAAAGAGAVRATTSSGTAATAVAGPSTAGKKRGYNDAALPRLLVVGFREGKHLLIPDETKNYSRELSSLIRLRLIQRSLPPSIQFGKIHENKSGFIVVPYHNEATKEFTMRETPNVGGGHFRAFSPGNLPAELSRRVYSGFLEEEEIPEDWNIFRDMLQLQNDPNNDLGLHFNEWGLRRVVKRNVEEEKRRLGGEVNHTRDPKEGSYVWFSVPGSAVTVIERGFRPFFATKRFTELRRGYPMPKNEEGEEEEEMEEEEEDGGIVENCGERRDKDGDDGKDGGAGMGGIVVGSDG